MSLYSERLAKLKKEIAAMKKKKSKPFKHNEKIIIDFINGLTKEAIFNIKDRIVILRKGDENKGFRHILEKHYCSGCPGELKTKDIVSFGKILSSSFKLNETGVTNKHLLVYTCKKGYDEHKIVLKECRDSKELVVTYYTK